MSLRVWNFVSMSYSTLFCFHFPENTSFYFYTFFPLHFQTISYNQHLLFCFFEGNYLAWGGGSTHLIDFLQCAGQQNPCYPLGFGVRRPGIQSFSSYTLSTTWESCLTSLRLSVFTCKIGMKPSTKILLLLK